MFRELLTRLITADRTEALGGEGLTQFAANTNRKLTLVSSAPVALSCTPAQCQCGTRNTTAASVTVQTMPSPCQSVWIRPW